MPVVGFLSSGSPLSIDETLVTEFRKGLKEAGYIEGQNVAIEYRWAEGQLSGCRSGGGPCSSAGGSDRRQYPAALAAKAATATIPIVFATGGDPVKYGLVASLNQPGGNVTGVRFILTGTSREAACVAARVAAGSRGSASSSIRWAPPTPSRGAAAPSAIGRQIEVVDASRVREIDNAFSVLVQLRLAR